VSGQPDLQDGDTGSSGLCSSKCHPAKLGSGSAKSTCEAARNQSRDNLHGWHDEAQTTARFQGCFVCRCSTSATVPVGPRREVCVPEDHCRLSAYSLHFMRPASSLRKPETTAVLFFSYLTKFRARRKEKEEVHERSLRRIVLKNRRSLWVIVMREGSLSTIVLW
jgi:hypothetical protein